VREKFLAFFGAFVYAGIIIAPLKRKKPIGKEKQE
jgi:hypothetical protein